MVHQVKVWVRAGAWCLTALLSGCGGGASPSADLDYDAVCSRADCPQLSTSSNFEVKPSEIIDGLPASSTPAGALVESEVCAADVIKAELTPVNLFLMVDRSGSMTQNDKWGHAVGALRTFLQDPATSGLNVALRFFSDDEPTVGCTMQACNLEACSQPLVDVGALGPATGPADSHEAALVAAIERTFPRSGLGTPIYPALGGALKWAGKHQMSHPDDKTVVVFVTDGEPNGCDQDIGDISNLAHDAFSDFGVRTYAIGLEGSNEAQMDQIARAGQTQSGIFIGQSTNAELDLLQALDTIRGQSMSCDFAMPQPADGMQSDPTLVNISISTAATVSDLYQVDSLDDCDDSGAEWYFDDPAAPSRIHLCPSACRAAGEPGGSIKVELGCVRTRRQPSAVR